MADEWICKDCGQATNEEPGKNCLVCGGEMVNIGEVDDDLKSTKNNPKYTDEEMDDVPLEDLSDEELETDEDEEEDNNKR